MRPLHNVSSSFLLLLILHCISPAQAGINPGFDPKPVETPDVPKTAPRPVTSMDLLMLRDLHGIQMSPDGKYVAYVLGQAVYETNRYRSGMFVIGTAKGSKPINLGTVGPPPWDELNEWLPENPVWSQDSRYIYHTMKSGDSWQVWRWDRQGGAPDQVTHVQHSVQSISLGPDGTKLVLTLEIPSNIDKKKLAEEGILYDGSFEATGQSIIDRLAAMPSGAEMWIQEIRSGTAHKATPEEQRQMEDSADATLTLNGQLSIQAFTKEEIEKQKIYGLNLSPDRKKVAYWRLEDEPSKSEWVNFPLMLRSANGGNPVTLTVWPLYAGEYWWSADSKFVYYEEDNNYNPNNEANTTTIMAAPASGSAPHVVLQTADFLRDCSADKSKQLLACVSESDANPWNVAFADLSTGEIRTLADVNPELQNLIINPSKRIDVVDKRGDRFWGHLVLPVGYEAGKRYPLVITTYADYGGFLRGGVGDEYPIHVFAANGFAVLNFNDERFRTIKPGDFDSVMPRWQGPMEAIAAAVTKLSDMGIVDRSKVGVTGLSHGAEIVNYGISHTNLFRAAIASGASFDPIFFYVHTDQARVEMLPHGLNLESPDGDSAPRWQKVSAALNVDRIHTPLLVNASDAEYIYAMQLVASLRDRKKPAEMFIYPDERHEKNQPRHRYAIYERNVDWLNFWLRDKEDSNPKKAEQYKRWRELRALQEKDQQQSAAAKH